MKIEFDDNYFMSKAIDEAKIALSKGDDAVFVPSNDEIYPPNDKKITFASK